MAAKLVAKKQKSRKKETTCTEGCKRLEELRI
jgi:hypothetical protein